jgi:hypothetical protein
VARAPAASRAASIACRTSPRASTRRLAMVSAALGTSSGSSIRLLPETEKPDNSCAYDRRMDALLVPADTLGYGWSLKKDFQYRIFSSKFRG